MSTVKSKIKSLLASPSAEGLIYALRNREVWPEGFKWNYLMCQTCALGLAFRLWREIDRPDIDYVGPAVGLSERDAERVFLYARKYTDVECGQGITPEMVADLLEAVVHAQ